MPVWAAGTAGSITADPRTFRPGVRQGITVAGTTTASTPTTTTRPTRPRADKALTAEQSAAARVRRMKMEHQRWALTFFADSDRPFTNAGRAESPDGPADVLETTDEAGRPVRYVIDPTTHLPLMVQYQQVRLAAAAAAWPHSTADRSRQVENTPTPRPTTLATVAMHLSGFKKVDGVMVPHQIDVSIDGKAAEGWTIETVKINPKVKPGTFKKPVK